MDFETLTRKELQALCKRNNIPANLTNVAMVEALNALDLVEWIGEITQPSQSGTSQLSTNSLEMEKLTSPTPGRSTLRTNVTKPTTSTRRTARKAQINDADSIETPAPTTKTNKMKSQKASVCLNMNSRLNECADGDSKDSLVTPAPLGANGRKRRVEESAPTRVSVRLAQKGKVETSIEAENEEPQGFKKDVDSIDELPKINDSSEFVSNGKEESEVVSGHKNNTTIGEDVKMDSYAEEEEHHTNCESEAKLEEEKCGNEEDMTLDLSNEVQGNDVSFCDWVIQKHNNDPIMDGSSKDVTELNVEPSELTLQQATKEADLEFVIHSDILVQHNENEVNKVANVAMAEALDLVECIGETTQPSQSGTSQFSTHSLETEKVTSPTVRRSTRRTNITKPAPDSVNPTTKTRRTTPAPTTQANKKKDQKASVCLNMNSQLNECADEDKDIKDSLVTPAPLRATGRKRRVEESAPTRVSVRLAQKSKLETSIDARNEESQGFKKDMTDNNAVDNFDKLPKITDSSEFVLNGKVGSEIVSGNKNTTTIGEDMKMGSYAEEEECTNREREAKLEEEKCDNEDMTLNVSNEVQGNDGAQDVYISEIETACEYSTGEHQPEEGESLQDEAVNFMADGNTAFHGGVKQKHNDGPIMDGSSKDITELNMELSEITLQQATKEADSECVIHSDILVQQNENEVNKVESLQVKELEKSDAGPVHLDEPRTEISEQTPKSDLEGLGNVTTEAAKHVPSEEQYVNFFEKIPKSGVEGLIDSRNSASTARMSTRRTNITKPDPDSVNPTPRTRLTTRKAQVNDADSNETPANRKKGQKALACLNINSQLNECADEDNKESLVTPAPLGATGRKRRVEESAHTRRQSVRLTQKSKVETSTEAENEEPQGFKKDVTDNNGVDNFDELPKITDSSEFVSNGKEESAIVSGHKNTTTIGENIKMGSKCDNEEDMTLNVSNGVQGNGVNFVADGNTGFRDWVMQKHSNGPIMDGSSKDVTELNMELPELKLQQASKEADSEFVIRSDNLVRQNENEVNKVESLQREELEKYDADPMHLDEPHTDISEQTLKSGLEGSGNVTTEAEVLHLEESEKSAKQVSSEEQYVDSSEKIPKSGVEDLHLKESEKYANPVPSEEHVDFSEPIPKFSYLEESEKSAKQVPSEEQYVDLDVSEQVPKFGLEGLENKPTETKDLHYEEREKSAKLVPSDEQFVDFSDSIPKSDIDVEKLIDSRNSTDAASSDPVRLDEPNADFSEQILKSSLEGLKNETTEKEVLHLEESEKSAKLIVSDEHSADLSDQIPKSDIETEGLLDSRNFSGHITRSDLEGLENVSTETEVLHLKESEKSAMLVTPDEQCADLSEQIPEFGVNYEGSIDTRDIVQPDRLIQCTDSDSMMMSALSKNIGSGSELIIDDDVKMCAPSENIGSGSELVDDDDIKRSKKRGGDLNGMSMRKLTKMLKGNLEKTKTPSKNENGIEEREKSAMLVTPDEQYAGLSEQIPEFRVDYEGSIDTHDIVQPDRLIPCTDSDSMTMKMSALSENIGSVSESVDDDDVKMSKRLVDDLHHMSMRKLAKMLKEKADENVKMSKKRVDDLHHMSMRKLTKMLKEKADEDVKMSKKRVEHHVYEKAGEDVEG